MKKVRILFATLAILISVTSCLENGIGPLRGEEDDDPIIFDSTNQRIEKQLLDNKDEKNN